MTTTKELTEAYEIGGLNAVIEICDKEKLPYSYCEPCETETPLFDGCCAVCGTFSEGKK